MSALKLEQFGGMLPAWGDRLLPPGQSALSVNGYLFSGELTGWRQPKLLRVLSNSAAKFVYRVPNVIKSRAVAYLAFNNNPVEGDTVTVEDDTYKFTATVTNAFDVLIGAAASDSATNFLAALTLDFGTSINQGVLYGIGCTANGAVSQVVGDCLTTFSGALSLFYVKAVAPDFGAAYNTTTVSATGGNVTWLYDLFNAGADTTTTLQGGANESFDSGITGASTWLEFVDPDTSVIRSPVVDDQFQRYYFGSPSQPPKYNTSDRIAAGLPAWLLGVPPPGCAPGVTVTGGGNNIQLGNVVSQVPGTNNIDLQSVFVMPIKTTGAMQIDDVSFMPQITNPTMAYAAVVFADNNGIPGELVGVGEIISTGITAGTAAVSSFVNPPGLLAQSTYWIGIMTDTTISVSNGDGKFNSFSFTNTFTNGPPLVAPATGTPNKSNVQMWADLITQDVQEARAYVYTWVTAYNEEGPPSPPTLVNGWSNGVWNVELFTPPADQMGVVRNITKLNVYRTVAAIGGAASFFFVTQLDVGTASYKDIIPDNTVALNVILPSTNWFPPPEGLEEIQVMPNGIAVGFKGNEIWFTEPYFTHAWPPGYVLTTEFPIVGLGISGQSVVACTSGTPYTVTGVSPQTMTVTKGLLKEPCISRGSIVSHDNGVYYESLNGLILVSPVGQAANVTEPWITREKWSKLTPTKNVRAVPLVSCYFAFGTVNGTDTSQAQRGYTIEMNQDNLSFSIWPQPGGHRLGFNQLTSPNGFNIDNVEIDPWTGICLLVQNNRVYYYDFTDQAPTMVPYTWRSKKYQQNSKANFAAMKISFDTPPGSPALSAARNEAPTLDASWNTLGPNQYLIVRVFADDVLVTTREVRTTNEVLRILSGFKGDTWQFEFTSRVVITSAQFATSIKELAKV